MVVVATVDCPAVGGLGDPALPTSPENTSRRSQMATAAATTSKTTVTSLA